MVIYNILLFCFFAFATTDGEMMSSETYPHTLTVKSGDMRIYWKFNDSHITFEVHGKTKGWVGIGFSPNGAMTGADIIVGWVKDGTVKVTDRHGIANAFPPLDPKQDIHVITGSECDGWTMVKFVREIAACEEKFDREITQHTERLIWAWGKEDPSDDDIQPWDYHGSGKGVDSVYFLESPNAISKLPDGSKYETFDLLMDDFPIPGNEDTYYNCIILKIPDLRKKHHIVKYEPIIQEGHEQFVHHILVYRCGDALQNKDDLGKNERCFSQNMQHFITCTDVIAEWAVGAGATYYPEAAGMSIGDEGDPIYVQLEIHYDNPFYRSGIMDNSGIRFTYTESLRQYDVGILTLGMSNFGVESMIPPGANSFTTVGHCTPLCLEKALGDTSEQKNITVFSVMLHAHLAGRKLRVRHIRDGKELPFLADDEFYDFNYQEARSLDPFVTIGANDYLRTECVYNTEGRANVTEFGLSTRQEMCASFLYYYPKVDLSHCVSSTPYQSGLEWFGITNLTLSFWRFGLSIESINVTEHVNATSPVNLKDFVNSFPWSSKKAEQYESYIREAPKYGLCIPRNISKMTFEMLNISAVTNPYSRPNRVCSSSDKIRSGQSPTASCSESRHRPTSISRSELENNENGKPSISIIIPVAVAGAFIVAVAAGIFISRA